MRIPSVLVPVILICVVISANAQDFSPPPGFSPSSPESGRSSRRSYVGRSEPGDEESSIDSFVPQSQDSGPDLSYTSKWKRRMARSYPPAPNPPIDRSPRIIADAPSFSEFPTVWFSAEALIWWSKAASVPTPLVTDGGPINSGGNTLLGDQALPIPGQGGGRFTIGAALGPDSPWAVEGQYFYLGRAGSYQGVSADGSAFSPELAFPYYDPNSGESSALIASPGFYAGTAVISTWSSLHGTDVNLLRNMSGGDVFRFDVLGGFRYVNLNESMTFTTNSPDVGGFAGYYNTFDSYVTRNNFYGGQVGGKVSADNGLLFFNATGKLALGSTAETVIINGASFTNTTGLGDVSAAGGYLTNSSNIGTQTQNRFCIIPEMNFNVGVYVSPWARLTIGYSFLYMSSVARPGSQMNHVINGTQSPGISGNFPPTPTGTLSPSSSVQSTDYWAQGLNLGLEFRF